MKTPPSVEDRSEYTDVFEDDIKGDVSMEYSGNEEDLLPSKSSSTNADNESETYSDLSPLVCDAKVNKDIHTSKERYPLSSNYIPPATNFAFTASGTVCGAYLIFFIRHFFIFTLNGSYYSEQKIHVVMMRRRVLLFARWSY